MMLVDNSPVTTNKKNRGPNSRDFTYSSHSCCSQLGLDLGVSQGALFLFLWLFLGYRGIVHPPSDDEGTERT